jgi:hypothetical protein
LYLDLQSTANGIRQDFKFALDKYNKYQQEKLSSTKPKQSPIQPLIPKPREKIENGNTERQMRYPAEDIRFKNKPPIQTNLPISVTPQAPLVSNVYQDDDDDDQQSEKSNNTPIVQCKSNQFCALLFRILILALPLIDIETPLLNVGEDFQALVSIAVNPSYFFVQNTLFTHDLEKLAQSMK